jgi:hypothetical protein
MEGDHNTGSKAVDINYFQFYLKLKGKNINILPHLFFINF